MGDVLQLFMLTVVISLVTFGGGSQALFYQYGVVQAHWITRADLSAMLAFGYATPGPAVFTIPTFIGYRLAGLPGAIVGTVGIFCMPFILAVLAAKYLDSFIANPYAARCVQGIGLATAGLLCATAVNILHPGSAAAWQIAIAACAFGASMSGSIHPAAIVVMGGLLGLLFVI